MKKKPHNYFLIVTFFVLANVLFGRLFHESLDLVCFSELGIIAGTSFIFWYFANPLIQRTASQWNPLHNKKNLLVQSGLAFSMSALNILISQGAIILAMVYIYRCTSPGFSFVNASLTNNIALNIFCYFALISFFIRHRELKDTGSLEIAHATKEPVVVNPSKILLTSKNQQKYISPDDITFIETSNNCIVIHTNCGKFVKYQSLRSFLENHHLPQFRRIHRSYAVNMDCIESIEKNTSGDGYIFLKDRTKLKFSRSFKHHLQNYS